MSAKRPSPWWLSQTVAKERLSRMKNVGAPCDEPLARLREAEADLADGFEDPLLRHDRDLVLRPASRAARQHARQLVREPRLAHVVVGAGLPDLEHALLVVVTAHGDDREIGRRLAEAPRRLDAVEDRHLDVHDDGIGRNLFRERDRLSAVARASGHDEAVVLLEQERDGLEERLVVLGNENSERRGHPEESVPAPASRYSPR